LSWVREAFRQQRAEKGSGYVVAGFPHNDGPAGFNHQADGDCIANLAARSDSGEAGAVALQSDRTSAASVAGTAERV